MEIYIRIKPRKELGHVFLVDNSRYIICPYNHRDTQLVLALPNSLCDLCLYLHKHQNVMAVIQHQIKGI